MNNDSQFEQRLRAQPVKAVPPQWRDGILRAAKQVAQAQADSRAISGSALEALRLRVLSLLWPAPKAWASLAGVWIAIVLMNFSAADNPTGIAQSQPFPSRETMQSLIQQQRLLAKLVEPPEAPEAQPQSPRTSPPAPRSQRRGEAATI